jgi:uncharacterized protein YqgC (DUF456 family)
MRWLQILVLVLSFLVMFIGVVGAIVPMIPGPPLVLAGAFIYAAFTKFAVVGWKVLLLLTVLAAIGVGLDYAAWALGAKRMGASRLGMWFGVLGLIVGLIPAFLPWGLIVGPLVGVGIGEAIAKRRAVPAVKASAGSLAGVLLGVFIKLFICFLMIGIFIVALVR